MNLLNLLEEVKNLMFFQPLDTLNVKNRITLAPMTRISATLKAIPTSEMLNYYRSFAEGGFGLIITEGLFIDETHSPGYQHQPGLVTQNQIDAWKSVVDAAHENSSKMIAQLMHAGALVHGNAFGYTSVAPSSIVPKGEKSAMYNGEGKYPTPEALSIEGIKSVVQSFVKTAKNAQYAGFDGIEIHAANGYLLDQFLTTYTNQRNDDYGGSLENRIRIILEVITAIKSEVSSDFIVGIRISQSKVNDFDYKWEGGEKDAQFIFENLADSGVDYIHTTEYKAWQPAFNDNTLSLAALAKRHTDVPIIANGHLEDIETAISMLKNKEADLIALGKAALANHTLPQKIHANQSLNEFNPDKVLNPDATN